MRKIHHILIITLLIINTSVCFAQYSGNAKYVDPFIGTAVQGHTYPGATSPFGLVQVSPETGNVGWNYCAGYHYEDKTIMGFSHTHLSGTGWMDLGDLLLMPFTGNGKKKDIKSRFSHTQETARAGYYAVNLEGYGINVELTATQRAAFHKYHFSSKAGKVLIDLKHGIVTDSAALETHVLKSELKIEDNNTLSGYILTKGWAGDKQVYFVIRLKQPFVSKEWLSAEGTDRNHQLILNFQNKNNDLTVDLKVGISTVSVAGARNNLDTEIPGWDFKKVRSSVYDIWDTYLSAVKIEATQKEKEIFYTALYHNLVVPNNITDVDGKYRGVNNEVFTSENKAYYSTLSLWDTFRATNSLYTLLYPAVTNDIVRTMLAHYDVKGFLPLWTLWGHENYGMIGNHSIPVIVEAYEKGIRDYDVNKAYEAIKLSSTVNHIKSDWSTYLKYGYYPTDLIKNESVSRTLESSYDDGCVAQLAKSLGKTDDYEVFLKRSRFYKNLFNKSTGFMQGRRSNGQWDTPFDPLRFSHASTGGNYTEGNAWPYVWHVMQDVDGLISLYGSKKSFADKLDTMFSLQTPVFAQGAKGLIGQYVHGNEPSHHVAYLYNYAGEPWKTQEKVNQIKTTRYNNTPAGLCGNDDCGQMSAWYIFSSMGFYPVNPADGKYVFGTPSFKKVVLHAGKKEFIIRTKNLSEKNIYIQEIKLRDVPYHKAYITHQDLINGGQLEFIMGDKPGEKFLVNSSDSTQNHSEPNRADQGWRDELDSTFSWFDKNPPNKTGSNFLSRQNKTAILDKYGWQISSDTWKSYRSCWINNPIKTANMEDSIPILYYLHKAINTSINEIKSTVVKRGAVIWKLYNMGYIVKTKDACFGIDINQPGSEQLVDILDFVIASHIHSDHNNTALLDAMVMAGKPVYSPFYTKGTLINTTSEFAFGEVKVRFTMNKQADVPVITSQIDCGPAAHNYTIYHIGDSRSLVDLNPDRHINLFIQHIENALNVFDAVARVKPDITVYDHVMELGHSIGQYRWSYQYTYNKIKDVPHARSYVLTWGEKLQVGIE